MYKNPEVDALIDDAVTNRDAAQVEEDYKEIQRIVSEDAIWTPLYSEKGLIARNKDLTGLEISSFNMHVLTGLHYEQ